MPYKDPTRKRDYDRQWRRMNADIYGKTRKPILPYLKLTGGTDKPPQAHSAIQTEATQSCEGAI